MILGGSDIISQTLKEIGLLLAGEIWSKRRLQKRHKEGAGLRGKALWAAFKSCVQSWAWSPKRTRTSVLKHQGTDFCQQPHKSTRKSRKECSLVKTWAENPAKLHLACAAQKPHWDNNESCTHLYMQFLIICYTAVDTIVFFLFSRPSFLDCFPLWRTNSLLSLGLWIALRSPSRAVISWQMKWQEGACLLWMSHSPRTEWVEEDPRQSLKTLRHLLPKLLISWPQPTKKLGKKWLLKKTLYFFIRALR